MDQPLANPLLKSTCSPEEWAARVELAACYRLVHHFRMTDLIYNHITVRVPGRHDQFLINPYGVMYKDMTASGMVKIDLDGNLLEPSPWQVNQAGFVIHSAIHAARHDVYCVLHTHTKAGVAVSCLEEGLLPLNQFSLQFHNRLAYHDYQGIALDVAERDSLVADLGDKWSMILRNHGLLTCGKTVAAAFNRMFYLNQSCEVQIAAQSAGKIRLPSPEVMEHTARQFERETDIYDLEWTALVRLLDEVNPGYDQ